MSAALRREELELKYDAADLGRLRSWLDDHLPPATPRARRASWRLVKVVDRYFDTPDGALAAARYGARLRHAGGDVTLGLKAEREVRGPLHHRHELEALAADSLEPADWPASEPRDVVQQTVDRRWLVERFRLRQRRRERECAIGEGGARLLLSLDEATVIVAGTVAGEIRQLEVELLDGERDALAALDRRLRGSGLVRAQPASKMVIAASLVETASAVRADDRWADAGRKVLRRHLLRVLEREPRVRAGDPLALKQMRVATRRARATWRLFADAFRRAPRRRHVATLRALGDRLGAVRDLDVLLAALPRQGALDGLRRGWQARRDEAFINLLAWLDSDDHRQSIRDFLRLTESDTGARRSVAAATVRERGPTALREAYLALVEADASAPLDDEGWHALRRRSRRLRYSIEALREVIGEPRATRLVARLVRVQDHLGELNDAVVAADAADAWLAGDGTSAAAAERRAAAEQRQRWLTEAARLRASFGPVWRGVAGPVYARMIERASGQPLTNH